eukprot:TRINITY_DN66241_c0_g1_i1.p1 TRINITY_DN66241_c0_g1~~TRINITY_DN66241_c0_g1_i1.p1  ORF type:complete len:283 (+),score=27.07 TRINITY_DN66241_c0_g1_i1:59-850(+)
MEATLVQPFTVVDDFLEPCIYADIVAQLPENISSHADGQFLKIMLPPTIVGQLRDFTNDSYKLGNTTPTDDEVAQLLPRVQYGCQQDHVDVTLTGKPVDGFVCLVYIAGSGTFTLADMHSTSGGEPIEHRIEVQPNRAVRWHNSRYSHRVDTSDGKEPRIMLGPYAVNACGDLTPVGANSLNRSINKALAWLCIMAVLMILQVLMIACIVIFVVKLNHCNDEGGDCTFWKVWIGISGAAAGCVCCCCCCATRDVQQRNYEGLF